jgi:hypothetical protein
VTTPAERERLAAFYWDILDVALVDADASHDGRLVLTTDPERWPVIRGRLAAAGASFEILEGPLLVFTDPAGTVVTIVET